MTKSISTRPIRRMTQAEDLGSALDHVTGVDVG